MEKEKSKRSFTRLRLPSFRIILMATAVILICVVLLKCMNGSYRAESSVTHSTFITDSLRAQGKLVVWEQDIRVEVNTEKKNTYLKWLTFKEKVHTSAKGKMGLHIDLGDTEKTIIRQNDSLVIIQTPLELTYCQIDLASIDQIKDASYDPTLDVSEQEIIKSLDSLAIVQNLPVAIAAIRGKDLAEQERFLSRLTAGKKVKIILTDEPSAIIKRPLN